MNTVISVVVLLVIGGFVWNHVRNGSSFGRFGGFGNSGGGGAGGRNEEENSEE